QRAQRPVGQPRSQNLALGGSSFALKKSSGNFSCRIGVLAVIHGQGQKIFFRCFAVHAGRGQHDRISITRHYGAVRLSGDLARLKRQCASAYFQTYFFKHQTRPFFSDSSEADFRYERQLSGTTSRKDNGEEKRADYYRSINAVPNSLQETALLTQAESFHYLAIPIRVAPVQVVQQ